jgi:hypothetical protein
VVFKGIMGARFRAKTGCEGIHFYSARKRQKELLSICQRLMKEDENALSRPPGGAQGKRDAPSRLGWFMPF